MKKHIIYLLLLVLLGTLIIVIGLPSPYNGDILKVYGLVYLSIFSGPLLIWFFPIFDGILPNISVGVIGLLLITAWVKMVKGEYPVWKTLIPVIIWVFLGMFFLFAEIVSHV